MPQSDHFAKGLVAIFANFQKWSYFSNISCFLELFFGIEQLQCLVKLFSACSFAFLIFGSKWPFCKGYSLCHVAIFANFQMWSHSSNISCFFGAVFCIKQLQCLVETFLACVFAFLIFDSKWPFCKGYIAFALWPFLPIFKMVSFFEY